jgi:hypothetical protein
MIFSLSPHPQLTREQNEIEQRRKTKRREPWTSRKAGSSEEKGTIWMCSLVDQVDP